MDTLDSLLESIAFENFTTNIHVAGLLNGNVKNSNSNILTTTNNHEINRKTDALNRYFDNLISFNREYEKYRHQSRKSDSPSDQSSELSDQQSHNNVRRSTQVTQTQLIIKKILKILLNGNSIAPLHSIYNLQSTEETLQKHFSLPLSFIHTFSLSMSSFIINFRNFFFGFELLFFLEKFFFQFSFLTHTVLAVHSKLINDPQNMKTRA